MRTATCVLALLAALALTGCGNELEQGGRVTMTNPGVHVRGANFWLPMQIDIDSNMQASADKIVFQTDPNGGLAMTLDKPIFGQDAAAVTALQPAKIEAMTELAYVGAIKFQEVRKLLTGIVAEAAPIFNGLAVLKPRQNEDGTFSITLANGAKLGSTTVTSDAWQTLMHGLAQQASAAQTAVAQLSATTQPAAAGP